MNNVNVWEVTNGGDDKPEPPKRPERPIFDSPKPGTGPVYVPETR